MPARHAIGRGRPPAGAEVDFLRGIRAAKTRQNNGRGPISTPKTDGGLALDRLLSAGTLDACQHAAALAYAA